MDRTLRFIWRTIIAGVLFLAPLLIVIVIAHRAVLLLAKIISPVASHIPIEGHFGMDRPQIAAVLVLILLGFAGGLLAQLRFASRLTSALEQLILSKMPGYALYKTMLEGAAGKDNQGLKVGIASFDDNDVLCFIIEQAADGKLTVFVPSAPTPTAGSIYYLPPSRVKPLDVPVSAAVKCIKQLGIGSRELLEGKTAPDSHAAPKGA
jgi:uncharacterized membrane protein